MRTVGLWLALLTLSAAALEMNQLPILSASEGSAWGNYRYDTPPFFGKVERTRDDTLEAEVKVDAKRSSAEVFDLTGEVVFGEKRQTLTFELGDDGLFRAKLPSQFQGKTITLYLQATDSDNNVALMVPLQKESDAEPLLSPWVRDEDVSAEKLDPSLNIVEVWGAVTEKFLTIEYKLQGQFSKGTLDPPFMYGYGGLVWGGEDLQNIFASTLFIHAPLFSFNSFPTTFLYDLSHAVPYYRSPFAVQVHGKTILFKIPREIVGRGEQGYKFLFGDIGFLGLRVRDDVTAEAPDLFEVRGIMDRFERIIREWRLLQNIPLEALERLRDLYQFSELTPYLRLQVGGIELPPP